MMTLIGFNAGRTSMGALLLDVLLSEEVSFEGEVTRYPTEDGVIISDHIVQGVTTVRIAGTMALADSAALFSAGTATSMVDVLEALSQMHRERALVSISTGRALHTDMGIRSLTASRSAGGDGGNWLSVQGEFVRVRKVRLQTADVPAEAVAAPAQGRAGQTNRPAGRSTASTTGQGQAASSSSPATAVTTPENAQGSILSNSMNTLRAKLGRDPTRQDVIDFVLKNNPLGGGRR